MFSFNSLLNQIKPHTRSFCYYLQDVGWISFFNSAFYHTYGYGFMTQTLQFGRLDRKLVWVTFGTVAKETSGPTSHQGSMNRPSQRRLGRSHDEITTRNNLGADF